MCAVTRLNFWLGPALVVGCSFGALDGYQGNPASSTAPDGSSEAADGSGMPQINVGSDAAAGAAVDGDVATCMIPNLLGRWDFEQGSVPDGYSSVPGKIGNSALEFPQNSVEPYTIPSIEIPDGPGQKATLAFWFYRPNLPSGNPLDDGLAAFPASSAQRYDIWLTRVEDSDYLCINTGNNDCWGIQDQGLRDRWVHLAVILNNGPTTGGEIYVDGQKRNASCLRPTGFEDCTYSRSVRGPLTLGGINDFPFRKGKLDDARLYARALTAAEIALLADPAQCH